MLKGERREQKRTKAQVKDTRANNRKALGVILEAKRRRLERWQKEVGGN
jgi:hypothetical protein